VKVQSRSRVTPWLFVAPAALLIAVLIIYPTFWTVRLSLYGGQGFNFTNFVGLNNFVRLLTADPNFLDLSQFPPRGAVVNNVLWLVTYTPLVLAIGLIIAVLADRYFGAPRPRDLPAGYSNTRELGRVLYTQYAYAFEIAAVILLVAIIAAIALTLRRRKDTRYQDPARQVKARREERVRLVSMPAEKE